MAEGEAKSLEQWTGVSESSVTLRVGRILEPITETTSDKLALNSSICVYMEGLTVS